jgi:hypothetical protein
LGCVWGDYDNDGFPDLFVTQYGRNALYRNNGNGTFTDVTDKAGVAGTEAGAFHSGATFFDYDRDGRLDLYVGSYVELGDKRYCDLGGVQSSCAPSVYRGSPDALYHNNGDGTFTNVEQTAQGIHYKQLNSLFHNEQNGKFVDMSKSAGNGFLTPYVGRGVAFLDFDNDGFVDVVVANNGDAPLLLHNSGGNGNHFLNFKLVGTKSNRDAIGARIRILAGGISQIREIEGGGSYLSQSDLRANFGLGKTVRAETVEVKWPSGLQQTFRNVEADKFYLIEEGTDRLNIQRLSRPARGHPSELPATSPQ